MLLTNGAQGGTRTHDFTGLQSVALAALPPVHCLCVYYIVYVYVCQYTLGILVPAEGIEPSQER